MKRRRFLGATAALAVTGAAGCVSIDAATATETHEFEVPADTDVVVSNPLGGVSVERGEAGPLRVRAEKHDGVGNDDALDDVRVTGDGSGDEFEVAVVDDRPVGPIRSTTVDLDLTVPPDVAVTEITADDGEVTVDGAGEDLELDVDDAAVEVRDRDGDVTVTADDGDLVFRGIGGDLTVTGDDGAVTATRVDGDVSVDVDDGDVDVTDVSGYVSVDYDDGDVSAASVGGVDDVTGDDGNAALDIPAVREDATVEVDDGDLEIGLGTDLDARLVVTTDRGDVDTSNMDDRFAAEGEIERLETTFGEGAHTLRIRTDDGDVELHSLE